MSLWESFVIKDTGSPIPQVRILFNLHNNHTNFSRSLPLSFEYLPFSTLYVCVTSTGDCSTYPCEPSQLVPNGSETCLSNKSFWPHLRCDPWCEALVPPSHASVYPAQRRRVGQNVSVQCDDRYYLTQNGRLVADGAPQEGDIALGHLRTHGLEWCGRDRKYTPQLGCLGPWCAALLPPLHGSVTPASMVLVNNTVRVICNENYEITGTGTDTQAGTRFGESMCMPDGYFDPVLTCDGPWCNGLEPPPHAISFPPTRVRVGEIVRVICKMGYSHWGPGNRKPQCFNNRTFEAAQWCYRNCGVHKDVAHASVWPKENRLHIAAGPSSKYQIAGGGAWPQDVRITCHPHYAAIGPGTDTPWCQADGTFTPHVNCRRICDPFAAPQHSTVRLGPIDASAQVLDA